MPTGAPRISRRRQTARGRIYLDVGGREDSDEARRRTYVDGFERMAALLHRKGHDEASLLAVLDGEAEHHEREWARRLPDALRFLLR